MNKNLISLILVLALFSREIYFNVIYVFFGEGYFELYNLLISLPLIIVFILKFYNDSNTLKSFFLTIFIALAVYSLAGISENHTSIPKLFVFYFIQAFIIISILKILDQKIFFKIIISILIFSAYFKFFQFYTFNLTEIGIKDKNYQTLSYVASFSSILIIQLTFIKKIFEKNLLIIILSIFSVIIYILSILYYGGRGAFLVLLFFIIYTLKSNFLKIKFNILFFSFITITILFLFTKLFFNEFELYLSNGLSRLSSISSENGLGNREKPWINSIEYIKNRPIIGYGIFNFISKVHPHNIILQLVLQFGIPLGIILFIIGIIKIYFTSLKVNLFKYDIYNLIFIYTFTYLMFSSNYMISNLFWILIFTPISILKHEKQSY